MKEIVFLDEAKEEMIVAAEYYWLQTSNLGNEFLNEIERTTNRISEFPQSGKVLRRNIRRRLVRRFPFSIIYREEDKRIVILAVMHLKRKPNYWADREN